MVARELLKVALAQIAQGAGFLRAQDAACELLVDVVLKYIDTIGLVARDAAELAGRTEANFVDVHAALRELEESVGGLTEFARDADEVPCARAVPVFPVKRKRILITPDDERADADEGAASAVGEHVPAWFPPFPDKATYMRTPAYASRNADLENIRQRLSKHRRDAEAAVVAIARAGAAPGDGVVEAEDEQLTAGRAAPIAGTSTPQAAGVELSAALPSARLPPSHLGARAEAPRELMDAMREQDKRKKVAGQETDAALPDAYE